jgi:hypothetical protein
MKRFAAAVTIRAAAETIWSILTDASEYLEIEFRHGVPVALKDNFDFKPGWISTMPFIGIPPGIPPRPQADLAPCRSAFPPRVSPATGSR